MPEKGQQIGENATNIASFLSVSEVEIFQDNDVNTTAADTKGLYSLSGETSYRQISWSLGAARFDVILIVSLWHLAGISAEIFVKFWSDWKSLNPNLAALRLHEILR